jgi:hypothetical protein
MSYNFIFIKSFEKNYFKYNFHLNFFNFYIFLILFLNNFSLKASFMANGRYEVFECLLILNDE